MKATEFMERNWRDLVSQEAAFEFYLGEAVVLGKLYKSPVRVDKHPTCSFWLSSSGTLYLNDFGIAKMFSLVDLVKHKYSLNFEKATAKIYQDIPLMPLNKVPLKKKEKLAFSFVVGDLEVKNYWTTYRIPNNIAKKYCFYAKSVYKNETFYGRSTLQNPIFVYKFPSGNMKIYRPLSPDKSKKWGGNADVRDIGGLFQLPWRGKLLFITSSIKDVMVLRQHGFSAICFNGEGYGTNDKSYSEIRPYILGLQRRFEHIVLFLDNDEAGRAFTNKLESRLGCKSICLLSKEKDISDFQKKNGVKRTFVALKRLLSKTFRNA